MKTLIATTALALALTAPAYAFNIGNGPKGGNASASSSATAIAGANANASASQRQGQAQGQIQGQGQSQSINGNNSSVSIRDRKQAPAVFAPGGFSSGHPCAYGGSSFGLSVIGGGGSVGGNGNKIDEACMLAQMGYNDAAMALVAARSPEAAKALDATGHIQLQAAPVASTRSTTRPVAAPSFTSCKMDDGAIRVGVKRGASDAVKARAVSDCRAFLR